MVGLNRTVDHTEVVKGREAVSSVVASFFRNAKTGMDICATSVDLNRLGWPSPVADAYLEIKSRGGRFRLLTRIDSHNSKQCKEIAKTVELRHLEGIRGNFGVSDTEYMAGTGEPELSGQLIYSNSPAFVNHHQAVFDMMWENGVPAEQKIQEIELGLPPSETKIIRNAGEAAALARDLIESSKREVLIVLASPAVVARNAGDFRFLVESSKERGFKIRVLAPIGFEAVAKDFAGIEWRSIAGINAGIAIYDGSGVLLSQYSKTRPDGDAQVVVSNVFTTNRQFVGGMISVFEAMWNESELRQAEGRSRRMAEVAQDILAHDIRNYNQVAMLSAESLEEVLTDQQSKEQLRSVLGAIRGSTSLIDKTRELGHILSQKEVTLVPFGLNDSLVRALSLIRQANPDRELDVTSEISGGNVLADDLLDEVFVNILSNAVKYTDGKGVPIEISLEEVDADFGTPRKFWKLTITDHGKGMAKLKKDNFIRYSASETGSGLGLSIVHALVVNRYSGHLRFRDRVEGDLTKGTAVEVWLPKAGGRGSLRPT
jgi:signal transduction histidine kinase